MLEVCPTCTDTSTQTAAPLADRGINDQLVELRPLVDETRFEFTDVSTRCQEITQFYLHTHVFMVPKCPAPCIELRSPVSAIDY